MLLVASAAWAQSRNITGIVFDTDGKRPVVGATVIVKGSAPGTISNADGTYTIHVGSDNDVLVFQSLGYDPQEVTVGSRTTINVTLKESAQKIDEVVVTALGLTRSEKSVGYAVSKVSGDELTKSISSNWVTGLNGKVAGMSMSSAGTGPGGTVRVTLRGDTSLNYGANEALFVIDGIPMSNGTVASGSGANYANSNAPVDFGNPISDLNPDDIENVEMLPADEETIARYGLRASNGVLLVTLRYDSPAVFPSDSTFGRYIARRVEWPDDEPAARVVLRYKITPEGRTVVDQELEVTDKRLRRRVLKALGEAPLWQPARKNGVPVESEGVLRIQLPEGKRIPRQAELVFR